MKITKTGSEGIKLIKFFEGFRSKPYLCPASIPTIGYGATYYPNGKKVTLNDAPIDEAYASQLLQNMLGMYEKSVDSFCRDDITQNQFDALVSFAYNLGIGALKSSTLLKKVNANPNDPTIRDEFNKWVMGGGKKLPGLVKRRASEADLYFKV
jgi:lysozyme